MRRRPTRTRALNPPSRPDSGSGSALRQSRLNEFFPQRNTTYYPSTSTTAPTPPLTGIPIANLPSPSGAALHSPIPRHATTVLPATSSVGHQSSRRSRPASRSTSAIPRSPSPLNTLLDTPTSNSNNSTSTAFPSRPSPRPDAASQASLHFGDSWPRPKSQQHVRIAYSNINGFDTDTYHNASVSHLRHWLQETKTDIFLGCESKINWSKMPWDGQLSSWFRTGKLSAP